MRVAIYIRFPFNNDGGLNVEQQLKDFASSKPDWEVKEVFIEKSCSLKRTDKTELNKLLDKCNNGEFDIILVQGIYHITRETLKYLKIETELAKNNVTIFLSTNVYLVLSGKHKKVKISVSTFIEYRYRRVRKNIFGTQC